MLLNVECYEQVKLGDLSFSKDEREVRIYTAECKRRIWG